MQNAAQIEFWNSDTARNWVTHDALMEAMLSPLGEAVLNALEPAQGLRALDVGCGCGHPTLSLATRVGAAGSVMGVDVSQPMLAVAQALAESHHAEAAPITFLQADAQTHAFETESFDLVFSRFGVMFFEDPLAAFRNMHAAMTPTGRMAFCCWQPRAVNPFMMMPAKAALELLPPPPELPPRAPGPFAFEEPEYVERILQDAGFSEITISALSHPLVFGQGLTVEDIVERLVQIGPIAQMVREAPNDLKQPVRDRVIDAVRPFCTSADGMTVEGAFWQVTASA